MQHVRICILVNTRVHYSWTIQQEITYQHSNYLFSILSAIQYYSTKNIHMI